MSTPDKKTTWTVIDCYKELPESTSNIPDSVTDCWQARENMERIKLELAEAELILNQKSDIMLRELLADWTIAEIDETGIRDCI